MNKLFDLFKDFTPDQIDSYCKDQCNLFLAFAAGLEKGEFPYLAPPFASYETFAGNIEEYYSFFCGLYCEYLDAIPEDTWSFVNDFQSYHVNVSTDGKVDRKFDIKQECLALMEALPDSVRYYFEGNPSMAYQTLRDVFVKDDKQLLLFLPKLFTNAPNYFRVRGKTGIKDRSGLFHPPFSMRELCDSYRFSIIGLPSLYLAESLETALKETNINNNKYSCSCFKSKNLLAFADLGLPAKGVHLSFWERYSLVLFYPLIMACGLKVRKEKLPFKPEYIIPQLLFQIIASESDFDGIKYNSTKYEQLRDFRNPSQNNYVLFARYETIDDIYSEQLAKKFVSTAPISPKEGESIAEVEERCLKGDWGDIL